MSRISRYLVTWALRHNVFLFYFLLIILITGISYSHMIHAFFSNDEYLYYLGTKTEGVFFLLQNQSWLEHIAGINRPFGTLLQNYFHVYFPLDIRPFIFIGIPIHILNCVTVYALAKKLSKNTVIAFSSGIIFASMNVAAQAVDWLACILEIPTSTFFSLISIYCVLLYVESKKIPTLVFAFLSAYVAYLFKDAVIFLFVALPLLLFIYEGKLHKKSKYFYVSTLSLGMFFILMRMRLGGNTVNRGWLTPLGLTLFSQGGSHFGKFLYNSFLYPLLGIIQSLVPTRFLQKFIDHPSLSPHLTQMKIDTFMIACAVLFCLFVFLLLIRNKDKKPLIAVVVLYVTSFIPMASSLIYRNSTFIEARYLYFPSILISILMGYVVYALLQHILKSKNPVYKVLSAILLLFIGLYTCKQFMVTRSVVKWDTTRQQEIKNVVMQLQKYSDTIPPNPIFYINSDYDYYWPHNKLPVQEGVGFMLEVIFYDTGKIPKELAQNFYLQPFGEQGYKTSEGKGFGYFYDETKLAQLFIDHPELSLDQIIAFNFASKDQSFTLVTDQIQERVQTLITTLPQSQSVIPLQ